MKGVPFPNTCIIVYYVIQYVVLSYLDVLETSNSAQFLKSSNLHATKTTQVVVEVHVYLLNIVVNCKNIC